MKKRINNLVFKLSLFICVLELIFGANIKFVYAAEDSNLVKQIENYTSEFDKKQIDEKLSKGDYEGAKKLIQTTKDGLSERWNYNGLLTNEMYIAYQFKEYMNGDFGTTGWWAKVTTWVSALFFNDELKDYLTARSPGKDKYKEMLKNYINSSSEEILLEKYAKNICTGIISMDDFANEISIDSYDTLKRILTTNEMSKEEIDKAVLKFVDANSEYFYKEGRIYVAKNRLTDTLKISGYAVDIVTTSFSTYQDIQFASTKMEVYEMYEDMLNNIQNVKGVSGKYIAPIDLRYAAYELSEELQGNYNTIILKFTNEIGLSIAGGIVDMAQIVENGLLSGIMMGIDMGSLIGNAVFDMSGLIKGVSYVEGYAYLGEIYSVVLKKDKEEFLNSKSEDAAIKFKNDYETLWRIRKEGEKSYLDMIDFSGSWNKEDKKILQQWTDYKTKKEFCDKNVEMVESFKFKFLDNKNLVSNGNSELEVYSDTYLSYYKNMIDNNELILKLQNNSIDDALYLFLLDIDFDNIPELFCNSGEYSSAGGNVLDIYGIINDKVTLLFSDTFSPEDIRLYRNKNNGKQFYKCSNGRMGWVHDYEITKNGLKTLYDINYDKYYIGSDNKKRLDENEISKKEYNGFYSNLDEISIDLELQYFSYPINKEEIVLQLKNADNVYRGKSIQDQISFEDDIKYIKNIFSEIQNNIKNNDYQIDKEDNIYCRYIDTSSKIRKIVLFPYNNSGNNDNIEEYYYDENEELLFVFVHSDAIKSNEYRYYYRYGLLIRYINDKGITTDYPQGIDPYKLENAGEYYGQSLMEIAWAYGD